MKNGQPDHHNPLQFPSEWKRGDDRMHPDQRTAHDNCFVNNGYFPKVVYVVDRSKSLYIVFQRYADFDLWRADELKREPEYLPCLDALHDEEYERRPKRKIPDFMSQASEIAHPTLYTLARKLPDGMLLAERTAFTCEEVKKGIPETSANFVVIPPSL